MGSCHVHSTQGTDNFLREGLVACVAFFRSSFTPGCTAVWLVLGAQEKQQQPHCRLGTGNERRGPGPGGVGILISYVAVLTSPPIKSLTDSRSVR